MPIKADCSACGHSFNAPSKYAGKKVRCPKCKEPLVIPAAKSSSVSKSAGSKVAVKCDCGKKFAAKAEWAGKKVKCPACSNPVRIPGGKAPAAKAAAKPKTKAKPKPETAAEPNVAGLFDEVGYNVEDGSAHRKCPECRAAMSDDAIICIDCGYNENTGKKMETYRPVTAEDRASAAEKPDPGAAGLKAAAARGGKSVPGDVSFLNTVVGITGIIPPLLFGLLFVLAGNGLEAMKQNPDTAEAVKILEPLMAEIPLRIGISIVIYTLPAFIAIYLLNKGNNIGRFIAMALGGLSLLGFPCFTVLGGLILWKAFSEQVKSHCGVS